MKRLLVLVAVFMATVPTSASIERFTGIGKDRERLTPRELSDRIESIKAASEFWLLRHPDAELAAERIFSRDIWPLFESASAGKIDPLIPAAIAFVESYGKPDAVSPTGPRGIMQMTMASGKELGLIIKTERRQVGTKPQQVWRGEGKARKRITIQVPVYANVYIADERMDPAKAVPAAVRRLVARSQALGGMDFAIQEYHDGAGRMRKLLTLYTKQNPKGIFAHIVSKLQLTYPKVFFDNTPYHRADVFNYLEEIRLKADYGPTYWFRVMKAYELLETYKKGPALYKARFQLYANRFESNKVTPNRMWSWFEPKQLEALKFEDLAAIQAAQKGGRLGTVPRPYAKYGIQPRLTGKSPIAEKDLKNQNFYISAEQATIGCLLYIANELRLLQGKSFQSVEVNSLVRSENTQSALKDSNSNARTALPTHTMGKAFDLPLLGKSIRYRRDLLFILTDMENAGMLAFIREGSQDTIHVVPHPAFEQLFQKVYRDVVTTTAKTTN